jgi:cysteine desulfurase
VSGRIYLDHNATNPPDPRLTEVYLKALREGWGNPSSLHAEGRRARALVEEARERVAAACGVPPGQVTFTASGTEALNQALHSVCPASAQVGSAGPARVLASSVEHPAVVEALAGLAEAGRAAPEEIPVDGSGRVEVAGLEGLLQAPAALVAVMAAQNEVGTLQPLEPLGAACAAAEVPLLVDAVQAFGRLARDWSATPWDYMVLSGHKLRAPRGSAALVHRGRAPEPQPLVRGGGQELGRRAGTEDVAAISALGAAVELAAQGALFDGPALLAKRQAFEAELRAAIPGLEVVASEVERLPQTTALLIPGGDAEALLVGLDLAGVEASSGSACSSGAMVAPRVLARMGVSPERAQGRLRFSFGPETTSEDLSRAVAALKKLC